jgi:hypothetical protein
MEEAMPVIAASLMTLLMISILALMVLAERVEGDNVK